MEGSVRIAPTIHLHPITGRPHKTSVRLRHKMQLQITERQRTDLAEALFLLVARLLRGGCRLCFPSLGPPLCPPVQVQPLHQLLVAAVLGERSHERRAARLAVGVKLRILLQLNEQGSQRLDTALQLQIGSPELTQRRAGRSRRSAGRLDAAEGGLQLAIFGLELGQPLERLVEGPDVAVEPPGQVNDVAGAGARGCAGSCHNTVHP